MKNNSFVHIEIPAPKFDTTLEFYRNLFLWKINRMPDNSYAFYDDGSVGGGFDPTMKVSKEGVNLIIGVEDIPTKLDEIKAQGLQILKEKTKISDEHGYYASFIDPSGNRISIWSKK